MAKICKRPFIHYWGLASNITLASAFAILSMNAGQFYLGIALAILFIFEVGNFRHSFKSNLVAIIAALIPFGSGLGSLLLCLKFSGMFDLANKMFVPLFKIAPPALFAMAFACGSILGIREISLMLKMERKLFLSFLKTLACVSGCVVVFTVLFLPNLNINLAGTHASQLLALGSFVSLFIGIVVYYQNGTNLPKIQRESVE